MEGNGQFCISETGSTRPVKLELQQSTKGFVNLIATLGDLQVCIACFRDGMYDPNVISKNVADQLGIQLDGFGYILTVCRQNT